MSIEDNEKAFRIDGRTYHVREAVLNDAQLFLEIGIDNIYADKKTERAYEKDMLALYKAVAYNADKETILKLAREIVLYYEVAIDQDTIEAEDLDEDYDGNIVWKNQGDVDGDGSGYSFRDIRTA